MKTKIRMILFLSILTFIACEDSNEIIPINESDKLIGSWINPIETDNGLKLTRVNDLNKDEYGISFLTNKECIERSSGWCGTPPITFFDFQGTWTRNDMIITISIDNGIDGLVDIKWEIKSLNDEYLIIERLE